MSLAGGANNPASDKNPSSTVLYQGSVILSKDFEVLSARKTAHTRMSV